MKVAFLRKLLALLVLLKLLTQKRKVKKGYCAYIIKYGYKVYELQRQNGDAIR